MNYRRCVICVGDRYVCVCVCVCVCACACALASMLLLTLIGYYTFQCCFFVLHLSSDPLHFAGIGSHMRSLWCLERADDRDAIIL